jgi:hypothetical protein
MSMTKMPDIIQYMLQYKHLIVDFLLGIGIIKQMYNLTISGGLWQASLKRKLKTIPTIIMLSQNGLTENLDP